MGLFTGTLAWGQVILPPHPLTIDVTHPLTQGLVSWWLTMSHLLGGVTWYALWGTNHGTLVNGPLWFVYAAPPPGVEAWRSYIRCDGVDDSITLGTGYAFPNTTFSVSGSYFSVGGAATQYIIGTRDSNDNSTGGWYYRINSNGTGQAVLRGGSANVAVAITNSTNLSNNDYHTFTIVFTTNTSSSAANNVVLYHDGALNMGSVLRDGTVYSSPLIGAGACAGGANQTDSPLTGGVDNIMIHNRALTAEEAYDYYRQELTGFTIFQQPAEVGLPVAQVPKRKVTIQ